MTSTIEGMEVLKQDARGRVRVSRQRREALVDEFEKSGTSAAGFAKLTGIKYPTFANWVQQRRKARKALGEAGNGPSGNQGGTIRLFEAVMDGRQTKPSGMAALVIELPGGSRIAVESPVQLAMAAELMALIAQRTRC